MDGRQLSQSWKADHLMKIHRSLRTASIFPGTFLTVNLSRKHVIRNEGIITWLYLLLWIITSFFTPQFFSINISHMTHSCWFRSCSSKAYSWGKFVSIHTEICPVRLWIPAPPPPTHTHTQKPTKKTPKTHTKTTNHNDRVAWTIKMSYAFFNKRNVFFSTRRKKKSWKKQQPKTLIKNKERIQSKHFHLFFFSIISFHFKGPPCQKTFLLCWGRTE